MEISSLVPSWAAVSQQCLCLAMDPVDLDMDPDSDLWANTPPHPWLVPLEDRSSRTGPGHMTLPLWPHAKPLLLLTSNSRDLLTRAEPWPKFTACYLRKLNWYSEEKWIVKEVITNELTIWSQEYEFWNFLRFYYLISCLLSVDISVFTIIFPFFNLSIIS